MLKRKTVGKDEVVIALCCKAGINRSVGLAAIVSHILETEGFEVQIVRLSKAQMTHRNICMDFNFCKTGSEAKLEKKLALAKAVGLWRSL